MTGFAVRRRLTGGALAILMQAGIFALLIFSHSQVSMPEKLVRELTFVLPRLREVQPAPPPKAPARANRPSPVLEVPLPAVPFTPNAAAPLAVPPDLSRLGQSTFGCAPEKYASLMPEQRALCPRPGEGLAIQSAPSLTGTPLHIEDETHWAAELAARNKPLEIPCTHTKTTDFGHGLKITMVMFDTTTCGHTPPDTKLPISLVPN